MVMLHELWIDDINEIVFGTADVICEEYGEESAEYIQFEDVMNATLLGRTHHYFDVDKMKLEFLEIVNDQKLIVEQRLGITIELD